MRRFVQIVAALIFLVNITPARAGGPFNIRPPASGTGIDPQAVTVIGSPQHHVIKKGQDLLDIARLYDLGWTEIGAMYRAMGPVPAAGGNQHAHSDPVDCAYRA